MNALFTMLSNVLLFVALAIPGYVLAKTKLLKSKDSNVLSNVLLYVGVPFMIVKNVIAIEFTISTILVLTMSAIITAIYIPFCYFITKLLINKRLNKDTKSAMHFSFIMSNSGFLGIPLATAVFKDQPFIVTVVACVCIVNVLFITTMGNYCISNNKKDIAFKKILFSPLVIAFIVGIILNLLNFSTFIPQANDFINHLASIVSPLSMIVLGLKMGEVKFKDIFINSKLYYVSLIKLVMQPLFIVGVLILVRFIIPVSPELIIGIFITLAMPTATLCVSYVDLYDGDIKNAVSFTLGSTILSVISLPLLYYLVMFLI